MLFIPLTVFTYIYGKEIIAFLSDFRGRAGSPRFQAPAVLHRASGTISLSATFTGLLQLHKRFFHAFASLLCYSIVVISGALLTSSSFGAMSVAYATIAGGFLQGLYAYLTLRKGRVSIQTHVQPERHDLHTHPQGMGFVSIGMGMQIVTQMVSYYLAPPWARGA